MQAGLTLVELMVSLTLGMLVVAAAMLLLLSSKSSFTIEDDTSRLLDAGRFAIENISRSVRQAGHEVLGGEVPPIVSQPTDTPNISGFDNSTLPATGGVQGHSDILQLRFFGNADGSIVNCAGITVPAVTPAGTSERGWSIYFVRQVSNGEPELHCGYTDPTTASFMTVALASGVESFQVLYGIDHDDDGVPDRFVTATTLMTLDPQAALPNAVNSLWKKVVAVKVALLLRGARTQRADAQNMVYDLFGAAYDDKADLGSQFSEADPGLPASERSRTRKVFSTTIQLRNRAAGGNVVALP